MNDLADEDGALAGHMLLVARDLAKSEGIAESGYRLIINCNRDGNQEVFHLHGAARMRKLTNTRRRESAARVLGW